MLLLNGAADEARTRYLHLGKVALYQMSYGRTFHVVCRGFAPGDVGYYSVKTGLCQQPFFQKSDFFQNHPACVRIPKPNSFTFGAAYTKRIRLLSSGETFIIESSKSCMEFLRLLRRAGGQAPFHAEILPEKRS